MASSTDYLPSREPELVTWANNFQSKIQTAPVRYGLTAPMATAFTALHSAWNTAYQTAKDPDTNSKSNTQAKNNAKAAMIDGENGIRALARIVQSTQGLSSELIAELGLTVRDSEPSPIPAPTVAPEIDFMLTGTRTIRVRLHNEQTLNRKKPEGVKGATLFYHVGEAPPAAMPDWTFCVNTTKSVIDINLPVDVASGSTVWFTAFWRNPRDQSGPATTAVSTVMQWGGVMQQAA